MAGTVYHSIPAASPIPGIQIGTDADYTAISSGGVITYAGTAKRNLTLRPQLSTSQLIKTPPTVSIVPTPISLGAFTGFSMPVYNADGEELFFRMRVPYRWDGSTNPYFKIIVALSNAAGEDVGDKFQFQLSWNNTSVTGAIEADTVDVLTETTIITDHSAQYSTYSVVFEMDYDNAGLQQTMVARNELVGRVRRIAASSLEVTGEIYDMDWITGWTVDKVFGAF
jgi:hypothetical protein